MRAVVSGLLLMTACGGADPPAPVSVKVLSAARDGAPDLAASVLFLDADGVVIERVATDAQGEAEATLASGGQVLVVHGEVVDRPLHVRVVRGVEPGDRLTIGLPAWGYDTERPGRTWQLRVPTLAGATAPPRAAAACQFFDVDGEGGVVTLRDVADVCHGATVPVLARGAVATDDVRYFYAPAVPFSSGVNEVPGTWQPAAQAKVVVTALPGGADSFVNRLVAIDRYGTTFGLGLVGSQPVPAPRIEAAFWVPDGLGEQSVVLAGYGLPSSVRELVIAPPGTGEVSIDFTTTGVPQVSAPVIANSVVRWTETPGVADLRVTAVTANFGGARSTRFDVIDDGTTSSVELPRLPDDLSGFDPHQTEPDVIRGTPIYVDVDTIADYDQARAANAALALDPQTLLLQAGGAHRLRMSLDGSKAPFAP